MNNMRLSDIHGTIIESTKTDFYDMYLLSSVQHNDDPDVQSLLTDRVDRLIDHFRSALYYAFLVRLNAVLENEKLYNILKMVDDPREMALIVKDIAISGDICPKIMGERPTHSNGVPMPYGSYVIHDNWVAVAEIFYELCNPPNKTSLKIMILDKLFGLAHNSGSLVDYIDPPSVIRKGSTGSSWLFDALYTRALAHPNELARHASHDARQAAKSADIGYGLGSSLSSYKSVTDADKLNLFRAKQERDAAPRPDYTPSPRWLPDE